MFTRLPLLALLAAGTCAHGEGGSSEPPMPKEPLGPEAMERHFEEAEQMRSAALRGEVDTVREVANAFTARMAESTYPEPWEPAVERLENCPAERVLVTDTNPLEGRIPSNVEIVSIAPLVGDAIRNIHEAKSVSSLFGGY